MPASIGGGAKRYAEAIFEIAKSRGSFDQWTTDLRAMVQLLEDERLSRALTSPAVGMSLKLEIVSKSLPDLGQEAGNLAKLLLYRSKLGILPEIAGHYQRMLNEYRGIATAEVTSAVPLSAQEMEAVSARLETMTGRKIVAEPSVDPAIMGGIVARIGDQLIDASVKGRLEALKKRLAAATS